VQNKGELKVRFNRALAHERHFYTVLFESKRKLIGVFRKHKRKF
jgi:hypothetical protein